MAIKNNSRNYRYPLSFPTREESQFRVFIARVLTVDYERKTCTLEDESSSVTYREVSIFPANASSFESTDIQMPEQG